MPPVCEERRFSLRAGLPHWTFTLADGTRVERAIVIPHGQNSVHVRYRLLGATAPAVLRIRPWLDFRPQEGQVSADQAHTYLYLMGYNAPEDEYLAWRDFFLKSSYRDRPAAETLDAMTLAITMNPFFLLHR